MHQRSFFFLKDIKFFLVRLSRIWLSQNMWVKLMSTLSMFVFIKILTSKSLFTIITSHNTGTAYAVRENVIVSKMFVPVCEGRKLFKTRIPKRLRFNDTSLRSTLIAKKKTKKLFRTTEPHTTEHVAAPSSIHTDTSVIRRTHFVVYLFGSVHPSIDAEKNIDATWQNANDDDDLTYQAPKTRVARRK